MAEVKVKEVQERKVYVIKHVGPYAGIGEKFGQLHQLVGKKGHTPTTVFGVFCDNPQKVPENELVSYACIETKEAPEGEGPVESKTLPGGPVARITAKGPYAGPNFMKAYEDVYGWAMKSAEYEPVSVEPRSTFEATSREFYVNNPAQVQEEDLLTEIEVPLRKRG